MDGWAYIMSTRAVQTGLGELFFLKKAKSTKSEWGRGGAEYAQNTMHEILRRLLQLLHVS